MSRSYKKSPVYTDHDRGVKSWKRKANKTVRRYKHKIPNGNKYKHLSSSYEIHDYISYETEKEARKKYYEWLNDAAYPAWAEHIRNEYKDVEDYINRAWRPYYKTK